MLVAALRLSNSWFCKHGAMKSAFRGGADWILLTLSSTFDAAWTRSQHRDSDPAQLLPVYDLMPVIMQRWQMRARLCLVVAAALSAGFAITSNAARAECDLDKPIEPLASRFEAHGETVYDRSTDLTWTRCSYGQHWTEAGLCSGSVKLLDWDSAMGLRLQGDASWRLPQRDELQSIVAHNCKRPAINETLFPGTPSIQYWTSTASGPSYAWVVFFRTGMPTWNLLKTTPFAVRMVRTGR